MSDSVGPSSKLSGVLFPGNPTKSYRSLHPFKVVGEATVWQGHSSEQVKTMKDGLAKLKEQGIDSLNDMQ
jgi:hypothetical protein